MRRKLGGSSFHNLQGVPSPFRPGQERQPNFSVKLVCVSLPARRIGYFVKLFPSLHVRGQGVAVCASDE